MNSVILCEGFDDAYILGYYLHKTSNAPRWEPYSGGQFSTSFDLPKGRYRGRDKDVYCRKDDRVAIWCSGGKDSILPALRQIQKICRMHPQERFQNLVILLDRDVSDISDCVSKIEECFFEINWNVKLYNNTQAALSYTVDEEIYQIMVTPIIIPFQRNGALETVLTDAISASGAEEHFVAEQAESYISNCLGSGQLKKYLQHDRERLKAEFSAIISITNPDRSTALFDTLLMTFPWEKSEAIQSNFFMLEEIFNR